MNNNNVYKMRIKIVSPVNISSGVELTPKDYLYDYNNNRLYFLNAKLWRKFIIKNNLLENYQKYLINFRERNNLLDWLKKNGYNLNDVRNCLMSSVKAEVNVLKNTKKNTLNNVMCQMKLFDGTIYIPGSSIKGFIKSAIMYSVLKKNNNLKNYYWQELQRIINAPKINNRNIEELAKNLEVDLLHKLSLSDEKGNVVKNKNVICSIMKGISCSDAYSEEKVDTVVLQKLDVTFNAFGSIKENKISLFKECIANNNEFTFSLAIDSRYTGLVGINNFNDLLKVVDEFYNVIIKIFKDAFNSKYPEIFSDCNAANMFLGSGTGFLTKTLIANLAPNSTAAKDLIKNLLHQKFKQHKHLQLDKIISPRTLKITKYKGKKQLMGLVEIRNYE